MIAELEYLGPKATVCIIIYNECEINASVDVTIHDMNTSLALQIIVVR